MAEQKSTKAPVKYVVPSTVLVEETVTLWLQPKGKPITHTKTAARVKSKE